MTEKLSISKENLDSQEENKRESQADKLYRLFTQNCNIELFHDQNRTEFARIPLDIKNNGVLTRV